MDVSDREELREALKLVAVALKESGVPFALTGGYAVWARGGPEPDHDVDFATRPRTGCSRSTSGMRSST